MSETPKKKASKSTPAKKQAQKKATTGKPGRPRKVVEPTPETVAKEEAKVAEKATEEVTQSIVEEKVASANEVVIHAESVKKPSLRKRMLKWFK